jgi:hypothetical protein
MNHLTDSGLSKSEYLARCVSLSEYDLREFLLNPLALSLIKVLKIWDSAKGVRPSKRGRGPAWTIR